MLRKKKAPAPAKKRLPSADIKTKRHEGQTLGDETADALAEYEERRKQYLRCSGMHTETVTKLVRRICSGENYGPGVAIVAPALYEGIPEFLDMTLATMGDIAVYASLYMGLVVTAGMSGFFPSWGTSLSSYYNGVCASPVPRAYSPNVNQPVSLIEMLSLALTARACTPPPRFSHRRVHVHTFDCRVFHGRLPPRRRGAFT